MGDSKIPIYAYVDESGNTGHNLFDEAQPDFFTAALVTKGNFDARFAEDASALAAKVGQPALHGQVLGIGPLEKIAPEFLELLKRADAHFYISRVEKIYLLATKIFDTFFDSGENAAVAWHQYNVRPLRLMLAFKLAASVDVETAKAFWKCILEPNEKKSRLMLPGVCDGLLAGIEHVPDAASRKIFTEALEWAKAHPEAIHIHIDQKAARQGHFPNLVAFVNLLEGLEDYSKRWKKRVARITHDEQGEFKAALANMHYLLSNAVEGEFEWAGERYSVQRVTGSTFDVVEDSSSPGVQVADVVLWLYVQSQKGRDLPPGCARIVRYALQFGWQSDFSFDGVGRSLDETWDAIMKTDMTPEKEAFARAHLVKAEQHRQRSMAQFERDGLPPFMREAPALTDAERD